MIGGSFLEGSMVKSRGRLLNRGLFLSVGAYQAHRATLSRPTLAVQQSSQRFYYSARHAKRYFGTHRPPYQHQPYYYALQDLFSKYHIQDPSVTNFIENLTAKEFKPNKEHSTNTQQALEQWLSWQLRATKDNLNFNYPPLANHINRISLQAQKALIHAVDEVGQDKERQAQIPTMTVSEVVQNYADIADIIVPKVKANFFPTPWVAPQADGSAKHRAAEWLQLQDQELLNDYRLVSEARYFNGQLLKRKEYQPGAVQCDVITAEGQLPDDAPAQLFDYKFGKKGLDQRQIQGFLQHGPCVDEIIEVRPSMCGGLTTKWART